MDNQQNGKSNTYDQIPRTSGNINFSDLFKALKEEDVELGYPSWLTTVLFFVV